MKNLAWNQIIIAFLLGAFFTAGVIRWRCGAPWDMHDGMHRPRPSMVDRFSRKLNLNDDQKAKLTAILEKKKEKMDALRSETKPRFEEIWKTTREEIRAILTPEQQAKFDKFDEEMEKRRGDRWKHRPWMEKK